MSFEDIKKDVVEENTDAVEVEADEDGAFTALISDEDTVDEMLEEDGCAVAVRVDTTGDGYSETIYVDEDGDGEPDIILRDTNCDGEFDTAIILNPDEENK